MNIYEERKGSAGPAKRFSNDQILDASVLNQIQPKQEVKNSFDGKMDMSDINLASEMVAYFTIVLVTFGIMLVLAFFWHFIWKILVVMILWRGISDFFELLFGLRSFGIFNSFDNWIWDTQDPAKDYSKINFVSEFLVILLFALPLILWMILEKVLADVFTLIRNLFKWHKVLIIVDKCDRFLGGDGISGEIIEQAYRADQINFFSKSLVVMSILVPLGVLVLVFYVIIYLFLIKQVILRFKYYFYDKFLTEYFQFTFDFFKYKYFVRYRIFVENIFDKDPQIQQQVLQEADPEQKQQQEQENIEAVNPISYFLVLISTGLIQFIGYNLFYVLISRVLIMIVIWNILKLLYYFVTDLCLFSVRINKYPPFRQSLALFEKNEEHQVVNGGESLNPVSVFVGYMIFGIPYLLLGIVFYVVLYQFVLRVVFGKVFYEYFLFSFNLHRWGIYYKIFYNKPEPKNDIEQAVQEEKIEKERFSTKEINFVSQVLVYLISIPIYSLLLLVYLVLSAVATLISDLCVFMFKQCLQPFCKAISDCCGEQIELVQNFGRWGLVYDMNKSLNLFSENEGKDFLIGLFCIKSEKYVAAEKITCLSMFIVIITYGLIYVIFRLMISVLYLILELFYKLLLNLYYFSYTELGFSINKCLCLTVAQNAPIQEIQDCYFIFESHKLERQFEIQQKIKPVFSINQILCTIFRYLFCFFYFIYRLIFIKSLQLLSQCIMNLFKEDSNVRYLK